MTDQVSRGSWKAEVKTLSTIMRELGHKHINILKVDIEGSEYLFLEEMFDTMGCPPVDQLIIEWHHFSLDKRYGASPEINTIVNFLHTCGFMSYTKGDYWTVADPIAGKIMTYYLKGYCKKCDV